MSIPRMAAAGGLALLMGFLQAQNAGTTYEGFMIVDEEGVFQVDKAQTVRFSVDGENITGLVIHLGDATKDLTFKASRDVPKDGSRFAAWFVKEFRDLASVDGTPVTYEAFLSGAYAGLSPATTPDYAMSAEIKRVADGLGLPVPERMFVIYGADRSPIHEFFCYPVDPKKSPPSSGRTGPARGVRLSRR
jgi:hypothetical protein